MSAPTTLTAMQAEINSTNLVDGPQLKNLLLDVVAYCTAAGAAAVPKATTTTFGTVEMAAKVVGTGTEATDIAAIIASLTAAGIMSAT